MKKRAVVIFALLLALTASGCNKSEDTADLGTTSLQEESSVSDSSVSLTEQSEKTAVQSSAEASVKTETEYWSAEETRNTHFYGNDLKTEESSALQTGYIKASDKLSETEAESYNFDEIENMSDEELIGFADIFSFGGNYSADLFIEDYFVPSDGNNFRIMYIPEGADIDEYCSEKSHYPMYCDYYEKEYEEGICKDRIIEKIEDNDIYSEWKGSYTEIRSKGECRFQDYILFMKNFSEDGKRYTGEMTADEVRRNFDILTCCTTYTGPGKIFRRVVETDNAFVYVYYRIWYIGGDWGLNDEIELEGYYLEISKEDGLISDLMPIYSRSCEIPDSAPEMSWEYE